MQGELLNIGWLLVCTALVFVMQVGFCCVETGLVRAKNSINVAIKNLVDFCVSGLVFWCLGFAILFGTSWRGVVGSSGFFWDPIDAKSMSFFLFQLVFCGTATTIVSGAVAERMRFSGYLLVALAISAVIYPVFGHWAWGGALAQTRTGWLGQLGFVDFAGSSVVHSVAGWVALAACILIGPRNGRYDGNSSHLNGHNVPLATIGVMMLWFGWFGFNGGSLFSLTHDVPYIIGATMLGGIAGLFATMTLSWIRYGRAHVLRVTNGALAGLVAITACCHAVSLPSAAMVGAIGGVSCFYASELLERWRIDDVVGAIPVHGVAGCWGTLAVALFGKPELLGTGLPWLEQFQVQLLGVAVCFGWSFGVGFVLIMLANRVCRLRVSAKEEEVGLNVIEHDASTELHDLLGQMETHRATGDFSHPVTIESFTEVGQVATQYNGVLQTVNIERQHFMGAQADLQQANEHLQSTTSDLASKVHELQDFNELAVGRELRMIELKQEVNELATQVGEGPRYDVDEDVADQVS